MGQAKHEMMRRQELEELAVEPLLKAGAVKRCEYHGTVITTFDDGALPQAYAIGMTMRNRGQVSATAREFTDAIKAAYDNAAMDCGQCEKRKED